MSINAKQKGNRFERAVAKIINKMFDNANTKRTPLSGGMDFKGDIICLNPDSIISRFSIECKNQEKAQVWKWLAQARNDCERYKEPLLVFTKNHEDIYAALPFDNFLNILKELEDYKKELGK